MGGTREVWIAASALSVVLGSQAQAAQSLANRVGVAAMVRSDAKATDGGGKVLQLRVGDSVFHNQKIATGPRSYAQIMFLDRSTLLVSPESELVVSEFNFDARQGEGRMLIERAKGLFRFVGGLISKRTPVRMRMSSATIGIRGAVVLLEAAPGGGFRLVFLYGIEASVVTNAGQTLVLNQPGFMIETSNSDGSDAQVSIAPADLIASMLGRLEGPPDGALSVQTVADSAVELLRQRLITDPDVTLEEMESILGVSLGNSSELSRQRLIEFEQTRQRLEAAGAASGGSGGGGV